MASRDHWPANGEAGLSGSTPATGVAGRVGLATRGLAPWMQASALERDGLFLKLEAGERTSTRWEVGRESRGLARGRGRAIPATG